MTTKFFIIDGISVEALQSGKEYLCLCPFHQERTPSFTLNPDKGTYRCFGCGKRGEITQ